MRECEYDKAKTRVCPWIGLVEVGALDRGAHIWPCSGAFVNAVALVATEEEFRQFVSHEVRRLNTIPLDFENVEPLRDRLLSWQVPDEIMELAAGLKVRGDVTLSTMDCYP